MFPVALLAPTPTAPLPPDRHVPPPPVVIDLDRITHPEADRLDGRLVRATLTAAAPPMYYPEFGFRAVGRDGLFGATTVYLAGDRAVRPGGRVTAAGVLRVVEHPGDPDLEEWTEVRVDER